MYKICKTPRSEARQLEFQNTLLEMMKKQRFEDITIVALCKEMGITRRPFYKYFDSLEDVIYATLDKELEESFLYWHDKLEIEKFFDYWKERKWLLDLLHKNGLGDWIMNRSMYVSFYNLPIQEYSIKGMTYIGWISAIISVLVVWYRSGMKQSSKEMENVICEMLQIDLEKVNKKY